MQAEWSAMKMSQRKCHGADGGAGGLTAVHRFVPVRGQELIKAAQEPEAMMLSTGLYQCEGRN